MDPAITEKREYFIFTFILVLYNCYHNIIVSGYIRKLLYGDSARGFAGKFPEGRRTILASEWEHCYDPGTQAPIQLLALPVYPPVNAGLKMGNLTYILKLYFFIMFSNLYVNNDCTAI